MGRINIMSFVLVGILVFLVAQSQGGRVCAPEVFGPGQHLTKEARIVEVAEDEMTILVDDQPRLFQGLFQFGTVTCDKDMRGRLRALMGVPQRFAASLSQGVSSGHVLQDLWHNDGCSQAQ